MNMDDGARSPFVFASGTHAAQKLPQICPEMCVLISALLLIKALYSNQGLKYLSESRNNHFSHMKELHYAWKGTLSSQLI